MEREFNSALPEADIRARLRAKTRPWSRADLWTAWNTFFSRAGGGGEIRPAKTAAMRGYVYAAIRMAPPGDWGHGPVRDHGRAQDPVCGRYRCL